MTSQFLSMTSTSKLYQVTQIILQLQSCDHSLVSPKEKFYKDLTIKNSFLRAALSSSSIIWDWHRYFPVNFLKLLPVGQL